jgi:hypothetical protein
MPAMEYETTLPGGFTLGNLFGSELEIDTSSPAIPDLELETSAPVEPSRKRSIMLRRAELPLMGNDVPIPDIRQVRLLEPLQTALEVDMSEPPAGLRPRTHSMASLRPVRRPSQVTSRLGQPIRLILFAVLLMIADFIYKTMTGDAIAYGPVRVFWVAGPMAGIGVLWLVFALIGGDD